MGVGPPTTRKRRRPPPPAYRRSLVFWSDSEGVADPVNKVIRLDVDIACIALCPPLIVAVGTADGSIIFYNCPGPDCPPPSLEQTRPPARPPHVQ